LAKVLQKQKPVQDRINELLTKIEHHTAILENNALEKKNPKPLDNKMNEKTDQPDSVAIEVLKSSPKSSGGSSQKKEG